MIPLLDQSAPSYPAMLTPIAGMALAVCLAGIGWALTRNIKLCVLIFVLVWSGLGPPLFGSPLWMASAPSVVIVVAGATRMIRRARP